MKVQEVILRAMAKRITWRQAAEIVGISDRSMRRWRERYQEFGYDGLFDKRRWKASARRVPMALAEQVLQFYREKYVDLNVLHFHQKLVEEHGIRLSYTWVKLALQGAGLVARERKRGVHRMIAAVYVRFGSLPQVAGILYAIKSAVIAIILQALWSLARTATKQSSSQPLG